MSSDHLLPAVRSVGELASTRASRQTSRAIVRAKAATVVAAAYESARVEAIADVTETALLATSHVSAIESLLITRTPHAEARLKHIADAGCAGMANVVLGVGRRI